MCLIHTFSAIINQKLIQRIHPHTQKPKLLQHFSHIANNNDFVFLYMAQTTSDWRGASPPPCGASSDPFYVVLTTTGTQVITVWICGRFTPSLVWSRAVTVSCQDDFRGTIKCDCGHLFSLDLSSCLKVIGCTSDALSQCHGTYSYYVWVTHFASFSP